MDHKQIEEFLKPKENDMWFARLPGGITLVHLEIVEVLSKVITVRMVDELTRPERTYAIADLEFIEKTISGDA